MARARNHSPVGRFSGLLRRSGAPNEREIRRLEERQSAAVQATQQWLSLIREMERNGETNVARYDQYYQAYLQAKQLEKRTDLELFNVREGLNG